VIIPNPPDNTCAATAGFEPLLMEGLEQHLACRKYLMENVIFKQWSSPSYDRA
jgi:hypothetical protein